MRTSIVTASFLCSIATTGCDLPGSDDDDDTGVSSAETGEGPGTTPSDSGESGGSESVDTSGGSVDESGSEEESGSSESGEPADGLTCTNATLFAGNPYFTGDLEGWNPEGQGLLADPPLRMRHIANSEGRVAIETQSEVWIADGDTLRRIAGDEGEPELQYQPSGPCADVRVITATGIAGLPNGNLVVADSRGGGLIELSDPFGSCTATPIAGNQQAILDLDVNDGAANAGDMDGPGAQAQFFGVERPYADADGNVYVVDAGNLKIKKIANDADRTVSTLVDYAGPEEYFIYSMTLLDGTLYVTSATSSADVIWAVDPVNGGEPTVLWEDRGLFEEVDPAAIAGLLSVTNDGVDLIMATEKGYVFRVSTAAESLGPIAGKGPSIDFPPDLDLTMPIPLDQLPLRTYSVNDGNLVRVGDDLVFTGSAAGVGFHLWSIHCE